jgi:hypothetical protein
VEGRPLHHIEFPSITAIFEDGSRYLDGYVEDVIDSAADHRSKE